MRKCFFIFIILIIVLSFSITSCVNDGRSENSFEQSVENEQDSHGFDYIIYNINDILMKINVHTGAATPLCPDPLCSHNSGDCLFFGTFPNKYYVISDNSIYFFHMEPQDETYYLISYNWSTGKITQLYDTKNVLYGIILMENYLIFSEVIYDEKLEDGTLVTSTNIYRLNINENNADIEKLNQKPLKYSHRPAWKEGERICWTIDPTSEEYTTNVDYKDIQEYNYTSTGIMHMKDYTDSEWYVEFDYKGSRSVVNKVNRNTGERVYLDENAGTFFKYSNFIIYQKALDKETLVGTGIDGHKYYSYTENKLYSINFDGSDKKLLCDLGDENYFYYLDLSSISEPTYNEYRLIALRDYKYNAEGKITSLEVKYVVVNLITGEYKFVSF